jgi:Ca2+-binding RTX toxin-like protein
VDVLDNDTDVDEGAVLTLVSATSPDGKGTASVVDGRLRFDPGAAFDHLAEDASETVVVTYVMEDENGGRANSTLTLTINGRNDAPTANPDVATTNEDTGVTIDLTSDDDDVDDGSSIRVTAATSQDGGAVALFGPTSIRFTPGAAFADLQAGQSREATIDYTIVDELGAEAQSTATVTVTGVNDAPTLDLNAGTAGAGYAAAFAEEGPPVAIAAASVALLDVDNATLQSATVRLTNAKAGDSLVVTNAPALATLGITAAYNPGTGVMSLTGSADKAAYAQALQLVAFRNDRDKPDATTRRINVSVNDGVVESAVAVTTVRIELQLELTGDAGPNRLDGDVAADTLRGEGGDDSLVGRGGDDRLIGGAGADRLDGGADNDRLDGGSEGDYLIGGAGEDRLRGETGDDTLTGGTGADILDGGEGVDLVYGGDDADTLFGRAGADKLYGDGGDDRIDAGTENDSLVGGAGRDVLRGEQGDDIASGGDDDDTLDGGDGADQLYGEGGTDLMYGRAGADLMYGGAGNDRMDGGTENDRLIGDAGDDFLRGEGGADVLSGGLGADVLEGGADADELHGQEGEDLLRGGDGNDLVFGESENDKLYGGLGDDRLDGEAGDDMLIGEAGADVLSGAAGADFLNGGAGVDRLDGGIGADLLYGEDDGDLLFGGAESDQLFGGAGNDALDGGDGDDQITGGAGVDTLTGGIGADRFIFSALTDSVTGARDTVIDFVGSQDIIDLSVLDANALVDGDQAFVWARNVFSGVAGEALLIYDAASNTSTLSLDTNGDKIADFELIIVGAHGESEGWLL